jgi:hypothetical protein
MIVWLWDAGRFSGISIGRQEALVAASRCLLDGEASEVTVELACVVPDQNLIQVYARLGAGWIGRMGDGEAFEWEPFGGITAPDELAMPCIA